MFKAINEFLVKRDMDTYAIYGLWLVFLFAVLSSIMHVAAMFGDGDHAAGILPALAIDGGLALATYALGRFKNNWVKGGFFAFMFLSVFANLDYTLQRVLGGAVTIDAIGRLDLWQLIKVGAKASPPLIGAMMMEINTGVAELKKLQAPQPSTALSITHQPIASTDPNISVDKPSTPLSTTAPQRRLKPVSRRALTLQPDSIMPVLRRGNRQVEPSSDPSTDRKNVNSEGVQSSTVKPQPIQVQTVEIEDETTQNAIEAVKWFSTNNNLSETARQQGGISTQTVRLRIKWLWKHQEYRAWVEMLLPKWVEENQDFLNKP